MNIVHINLLDYTKKFTNKGKQVIQGPGENAGVIDIGDDDAIVFKIESHNHPPILNLTREQQLVLGNFKRCFYNGSKAYSFIKFNTLWFAKA